MSILFSIIRVIHGSPRLRGFTYACVAFFAACWVILIVEKAWQCASDPGWQQVVPLSTKYFCVVEPQISIFEFTSKAPISLTINSCHLRLIIHSRLYHNLDPRCTSSAHVVEGQITQTPEENDSLHLRFQCRLGLRSHFPHSRPDPEEQHHSGGWFAR